MSLLPGENFHATLNLPFKCLSFRLVLAQAFPVAKSTNRAVLQRRFFLVHFVFAIRKRETYNVLSFAGERHTTHKKQ